MSSINPVSRSMNGIKTIETAEVIFTDDNSSLNTSAGIVSAQTNSTNALNGKINSVDFNTNTGVLTLTKEDGGTLTKDLDGRYIEATGNQTITGIKTFNSVPVCATQPTTNTQLANKQYVDDNTITAQQISDIATNNAKIGITAQQISDIATNNAKTGITAQQISDIATNNAKTGITAQQISDIATNNAKTGITTAQANAIQNALNNATISGQNLTFTKEDGTQITIIIPTTSITIGKFFSSQYSKSSGSATLFGVSAGNPSDTNFDQFNGLITANGTTSKLEVEGINGNADKVHLQFSVAGEWNSTPYNKGIAIGVYRKYGINGTYSQLKILRGLIVGNRARFVKNFTTAHPQDAGNTSTTMESCDGMYIYEDLTLLSGYFYKFQLILVNSSDNTNHEFQINQVQNSASNLSQETAISCFTAQEHYD